MSNIRQNGNCCWSSVDPEMRLPPLPVPPLAPPMSSQEPEPQEEPEQEPGPEQEPKPEQKQEQGQEPMSQPATEQESRPGQEPAPVPVQPPGCPAMPSLWPRPRRAPHGRRAAAGATALLQHDDAGGSPVSGLAVGRGAPDVHGARQGVAVNGELLAQQRPARPAANRHHAAASASAHRQAGASGGSGGGGRHGGAGHRQHRLAAALDRNASAWVMILTGTPPISPVS